MTSIAQSKDSLGIIKKFVAVCTNYKQLPLHVKMEVRNATNFIMSEEDSTRLQAEFYINQGRALVKMGAVEQIVTDSLTLMVNHSLKHMVLIPYHGSIASHIPSFSILPLKDSSLMVVAKKYTVEHASDTKGNQTISLTDRTILSGSSWPREKIEVVYNEKFEVPILVTQTKRSLIPLDSINYKILLKNKKLSPYLLCTQEKGYYLIKEKVTSYSYLLIDHNPTLAVPVTIADRIRKENSGKYVPVPSYGTFSLTQNH
jgi:hypothetical protein